MMLFNKFKMHYLGFMMGFAFLAASGISAEATTTDVSLTINSQSYTGTYEGDLENDLPSGEGIFSYSDEDDSYTVSGTWKNGLLNGSVTLTASDGTYTTCRYTDGKPFGRLLKYDANGQLMGYDFYYQMRTISSLEQQCTEADYNLLVGTSFPDTPQKITGTVTAVFSSAINAYVIVMDEQDHPYVLTYVNNSVNKFNQGIVPNVQVGDQITAYGYLQKQDSLDSLGSKIGCSLPIIDVPTGLNGLTATDIISKLSPLTKDSETVYNELSTDTLPFILVFAAEVDGAREFNIQEPSMDYDDIVTNPYLYSNLSYTLTGTVQKSIVNYENGYVKMLIFEKDTEHAFYVKYRYTDGSSLPATGDDVTVDGTFNGNYKKIIPAEDAKQISTPSKVGSVSSNTADQDSETDDTAAEALDAFLDEDVADEYENYDDIFCVILYPRLTTTSVSINK